MITLTCSRFGTVHEWIGSHYFNHALMELHPLPTLKQSSKISCRLAEPHEGLLVRELVRLADGPLWDWVDWTNIYPYWLIGELNGEPRGTLMVSPSLPFGHLEILCVDPRLPHRDKALLVRDLGYAGIATCKAMGCSGVMAGAGWQDEGWAKILTRRGWREREFGSFLVKRI